MNNLAKLTSKPMKEYWTALKRQLQYARGTLKHDVFYTNDGSSTCIGYTDTDWAGDVDDCKLTSGDILLLSS